MKLGLFAYVLLCCSVCFAQNPETCSDCQKRASNQRDLQICADQEFARVDADMTRDYQQLLARVHSDAVAEKKIRAAQQAWLSFRDAQNEAQYPHEDKSEYGTSYPMCTLLLKTELTRQRGVMLSKMLNPLEGDACGAGLHYRTMRREHRDQIARPSSGTTNPPNSTAASRAATVVVDRWLGRWIGPEGTYLVLSKKAGTYLIEIHSLDGPATYEGMSAGDHIEFQRNLKTESINAGDGHETGMKWLLDKKNCLIIRTGEGFCRDESISGTSSWLE